VGQRLAALVVASAVGLTLPVWAANQSDGERTGRKALAFFEGHSDETIDAFLMRLRPAPLDEASRAKVIASLRREGEIRPSRKNGEKLSAAQRILDYSALSGAVTIKVVELDSAFVGLYYRTVVLVSGKALALFSADELAAVVAHEMGHDDNWNEYSTAMQARDNEKVRELELKADGIAVLTLEHLGSSPDRLVSAVQKVMHCNDWQDRTGGATPQDSFSACDRYVSRNDRIAFIRAVAQLRWADWPPTVAARRSPERSAWAGEDTVTSLAGKQALCYFESHVDIAIDGFLAAIRPAPLDAALRAAVLARLPKQGERRVRRPEPAELAKIAAATPVLQYHARSGVLTFTVIEAQDPFVSLHHRCSVIASKRALAVLGAEEFAALVAHEIGHEFFWDEYWVANRQSDHDRMRELELRCDGIAILTLRRVGIDPGYLVSAVEKMTPTNRRETPPRPSDYVSLEERVAFIRAVARLPWR
jgi:hypothetical protein